MSDVIAERARRRNGLPLARRASGPLGKRIATNPWTWVAVAMTLIYVACLIWQYRLVSAPIKVEGGQIEGLNWAAVRDSAKLAFPTLAVWIVLYVWVDRFRPQRLVLWWLALGWGGAVATAASMIINTWAAQKMNISGNGDPTQGARAAIFVAPFVEEASKASVVFLIAIAYRYRLVSALSGVVLGGLSAAGFAFTENVIYYARAIVYSSVEIGTGDPQEAVDQLVRLRGGFLAFGHPLFTTMTAVGVLVAVRTHSKVVRVLAPLAGYLLAALLHMLFNTGASLLGESTQVFMYFVVALPLVLTVVIRVIRQLFVEGRRLRARLADYVMMGWLSEADAIVFSRQRSRWWAAIVAATRGWRCLMATLAMQRKVTELAYLRDSQVAGTVDAAGNAMARALLLEIEAVRAEAVADPRGQRLNLPDVPGLYRLAKGKLTVLTRRRPGRLPPAAPANPVLAPVGSPTYSPVDPRWGPPTP